MVTTPDQTQADASSSSHPSAAPKLPPNRRKVRYAKVYGYLLNPYRIHKQALKDGTVIEGPGELYNTFTDYQVRLARHCGIKLNDMITVRNPERNPEPDMPPIYCLVAATNLSKRSKIPRTDIIQKGKEFSKTEEEPKWYYIVRG